MNNFLTTVVPILTIIVLQNVLKTSQNPPTSLGFVQFRCPLPRTSRQINFEGVLNQRIIQLNETNGRKVRIQFFYPNPINSSLSYQTVRNSTEDLPGDFTAPMSSKQLETTPAGVTSELLGETETTEPVKSRVKKSIAETEEFDILCQWKFLAANSSQYLLLTFNKMSAPYSNDCEMAYVSMQKDDGYESRWCGNRRQGNGRPLALFSRSNATVTVFRRARAPNTPSTGFSVTVESFENTGVRNRNTKETLRILTIKA